MRIELSEHFTIHKLLRFSMPSILMMIFTSIYSVVDGFFVSNFAGKIPFAALNLVYPVLMIIASIGLMFGTGGSAIVAKALGEKEPYRANQYFSLFVYAAFIIGIFFSVIGFLLISPICSMLGAEGQLLHYSTIYGKILLCALPFYILQLLFQSFFVTSEKPKLGFGITVISGLTNMVLDFILVTSFPMEYKLHAAALATASSQCIGGIFPLFYFFKENDSLLRIVNTSFDAKILKRGCLNGSSELMTNISMSIVSMLYNLQLLKYAGEDGVSAYGVMMYVGFVFSAAFFGYSIGTAPIIGYHDGAQHYDELKSLLKKSLYIISIFSFLMTIAAFSLSSPLSEFFVGYDSALKLFTIHGFRIYSFSFIFMGFGIYGSGFFTALNDGLTSALISFLRTLIFQVASVLALPLLFDIDGIWYSLILAECMSVLLTSFFLIKKKDKYHY